MHLICKKGSPGSGNLDIFKIILEQCYDAKDSLDCYDNSPMDYAAEAQFVHLIEYSKSVTNVLFSRDY
jgi:hypothetical protein